MTSGNTTSAITWFLNKCMGPCKITKNIPSKKYYLLVRDMQTAFRFFNQEKELKKPRSKPMSGSMMMMAAFVEIPPAEKFLDQAIQQDKEIPAAHFPDFKFGYACFPVGPAIGNNGIGIASDDSF
jgi:hypothetical protein